jgi:septum formation protein
MSRCVVLASGSEQRQMAIKKLGIPFTVSVSNIPEDISPDWTPEVAVVELATRKACAVGGLDQFSNSVVVGCDTLVALGDSIFGKPLGPEDAKYTLTLLRGKTHRVLSGLAILDGAANRIVTGIGVASVTMRSYSDSEVDDYVATGEPLNKAGSYAIQGIGGSLVASYDGGFDNIVGLPLNILRELLAKVGVSIAA